MSNVLHYPGVFTNPFVQPEASYDWPFPVLMDGPSGSYLGCRHYLYSVDASYNLTQLTAWFPEATHWSYADFHDFQIFHTGSMVIVKDVASGDFFFDYAFPSCRNIMNFRGQLIIGSPIEGDNVIKWGKIGYHDFTIDMSNEAGFTHMPVNGPVHKIVWMNVDPNISRWTDRGFLVVFLEKGIVTMQPVSEPVIGWAKKQSNDAYGIASPDCVGGHEDEQLFIDNRGFLHKYTVKGDELLGYREFLQPMLGDDPIISYDHIEDQYFISSEKLTYVFNKSGLGQIDQIITSGWIDNDKFMITGYTPKTMTIELSSDEVDFNIRSKKHLSVLSFGLECDGKCYASVEYKDLQTGLYRQTGYKPLSPAGVCFPSVTGVDFRIRLKAVNFTMFQLDEAFARWKLVDKTSIRGTYDNAKATS